MDTELLQKIYAEVLHRPSHTAKDVKSKYSEGLEDTYILSQVLHRQGYNTDGLGFYKGLRLSMLGALVEDGLAPGTESASLMADKFYAAVDKALDKHMGAQQAMKLE